MMRIKLFTIIFLIIIFCSSCNIKSKSEKNENEHTAKQIAEDNNKIEIDSDTKGDNSKQNYVNDQKNDNNKNNVDSVNMVNTIHSEKILLQEAKLSDEIFDSYYIEVPNKDKLPDNVFAWFPDYHIGEENIFYIVAYARETAQFPYNIEIHSKNIATGENKIIYQSSDKSYIRTLSNLCSTSKYLFFVETRIDGGEYILKMDLKTNAITEIRKIEVGKTSFNYLCPLATSEFLTWYESEDDWKKVKGMIYNHVTDELFELPFEDMVFRNAANAKLNIIDSVIMFFTQNNEGELFINKYDLHSKEILSVLIEGNPDIASKIMSNKEWICWFEKVDDQRIFMYNIKNNKLYSINKDNKYIIYSSDLKDNIIYVNAKEKDNYNSNCMVYKVLLDTMEITGYTSIDQGLDTYTSYFQVRSGQVYLYSYDNDDGKTYIHIME